MVGGSARKPLCLHRLLLKECEKIILESNTMLIAFANFIYIIYDEEKQNKYDILINK